LKNIEHRLSTQNQQRKIELVQFRITPYFLIALFSFAIMCVRIFMLPNWKWWMHVTSFFTQTVFMILIWRFIRWLNGQLERVIPFEKGPAQRMFIQVMIVLLLLSPFVIGSVTFARPYLPSFVNKQVIALLIMMFVVMIVLLNFSFYAGYFFKNWQQSVVEKAGLEVQAARLEQEKFHLQYHQLRNQVNPHYLFNTLSSLDSLIQTNPDLASEFVRHMAKVYRYVLQHKENEVVSLNEEMEFIGHYLHLLHTRYQEGLRVECHISEAARERGVVMVTLQLLLDNAIKHNIVQPESPLQVSISDEHHYLVVRNNKQLRKQIETSNGHGLAQLRQLYSFLSDRAVVIEDTDVAFTVKIPLL
jgi:two-component system, LytTR family, sensor kinase